VAGLDPTPGATLTRLADGDALAAGDVDGLVRGEPLALAVADDRVADDCVVGAADVVTVDGGMRVDCAAGRGKSAYAAPPAASTTRTATMMNAVLAPREGCRAGAP
jgi:hypothetical protein